MIFDRKIFKGSDILHSFYNSIEIEFEQVTRLLDYMDSEIKSESKRLEKLLSEDIKFASENDEQTFYSHFEFELDSYKSYYPYILRNSIFVSMFSLFESYFKILVHQSQCRLESKQIEDKEQRKINIKELKDEINNKKLYQVKNHFVCLHNSSNIDLQTFDLLWCEISKFIELRNSIIHNDCEIKKNIEKHWKKVSDKLITLEDFIKLYFNDKLLIVENKFKFQNNEFLRETERIYLKFLEELIRIVIEFTNLPQNQKA